MVVGLNLRQRADQMAVRVKAVFVVDVDKEIGAVV